MKGLFQSQKFRQGSAATAIVAIVTAIIVVVNVLATTLTDRYNLTLDITAGKLFSITEQTETYLAELDKDVNIYVLDKEEIFMNQSEYYLQALQVLKTYDQASDHITLEYIDLAANPTFAQDYPSLQLSSNSILVASGENARALTPYDLYNIETDMYGQGYITASVAEQTLTSTILALTSEETVSVAVISGHNEEDISTFTTLLESNNYMTGEVNLSTSEIDSAYTAAIISAPQRDFTKEELQRLDDFLENSGQYGKTLFYFAPSEQTDTPVLDAFLADWGIQVGEGMVYETDSSRYYPQNPYIALLDYAEEIYSSSMLEQNLVALTAYARPLELVSAPSANTGTTILLEFADSAEIMVNEEDPLAADGSIPYAIQSTTVAPGGSTQDSSQVIVFGSSAFVDPSFLSSPNYANSAYMLEMMADLTGQENALTIESKELSTGTMDVTYLQALLGGVFLVIILPLIVLIFGLTVWARRRHR